MKDLKLLTEIDSSLARGKHPEDMYDEMNHKSEKCAEVLVPDRVKAQFVVGAYVANQTAFTARDESGRRANLDYRCRHLADRVDCI